jgi:hypothetical protein
MTIGEQYPFLNQNQWLRNSQFYRGTPNMKLMNHKLFKFQTINLFKYQKYLLGMNSFDAGRLKVRVKNESIKSEMIEI